MACVQVEHARPIDPVRLVVERVRVDQPDHPDANEQGHVTWRDFCYADYAELVQRDMSGEARMARQHMQPDLDGSYWPIELDYKTPHAPDAGDQARAWRLSVCERAERRVGRVVRDVVCEHQKMGKTAAAKAAKVSNGSRCSAYHANAKTRHLERKLGEVEDRFVLGPGPTNNAPRRPEGVSLFDQPATAEPRRPNPTSAPVVATHPNAAALEGLSATALRAHYQRAFGKDPGQMGKARLKRPSCRPGAPRDWRRPQRGIAAGGRCGS